MDRWTDTQINTQTDMQTDKQTDTEVCVLVARGYYVVVVPLRKQRGGKFLKPWEEPDQMNLDEVRQMGGGDGEDRVVLMMMMMMMMMMMNKEEGDEDLCR